MKKISTQLCALLLSAFLCTGCAAASSGAAGDAAAQQPSSAASDTLSAPPDAGSMPPGGNMADSSEAVTQAEVPTLAVSLSDRDKDSSFDAASAVSVALSGSTATVSGTGASVTDGILTINAAGTYVLSGSFTGGIVVEATNADKIQLVLSGAQIAAVNGPALWIRQADKVFLTAVSGTQNTLSDSAAYTDLDSDGEPDACIFSKDDLTINGGGSLSVTGNYAHAIVSKDDLVVYDVTLEVSAAKDGLKGTDSLTVSNAALTVSASGDGLRTNNADEEGKGNVLLSGGSVSITSGKDGVHAAASALLAADTLTISATDDGVHADSDLVVQSGVVRVTQSYEGLEALAVYITGGDCAVVSSDDGVNAAGGSDSTSASTDDVWGRGAGNRMGGGGMFEVVEGALIYVSGGTLTVNAEGDGLDSNGNLLITGGSILVNGPVNDGNGALDYNGSGVISGGTLVAVGSAGMAMSLGSASTQPVLSITLDTAVSGGTQTVLATDSGTTVLDFTPAKNWQNVVLSSPSLAIGSSYTLTAGGTTLATVTLSDLVTSSGNSGMGGMQQGGMQQGGGMGGHGGGPGKNGGNPGAFGNGQNAPGFPDGQSAPQGTPPAMPENSPAA